MNARLDYDLKAKTGAILFYDLNAEEFDRLRILFKTIFEYGQFSNAEGIAKELGLQKMINEIANKEVKKDETQRIVVESQQAVPPASS